MSIEAMKQALEALAWVEPCDSTQAMENAIDALCQAIEQAEKQEPVATVESVATVVSETGDESVTMSWWHEPALPVGTKLYTSPPQRQPLTDEQYQRWAVFCGICRKQWSVPYQHPGKSVCDNCVAAHGIKGEA